MRIASKRTLKSAFFLCGLLSTVSAFAAGGTFDYGFSEITRGMGGAGVALPQDTLIAAINPAGMVDVGPRMDLGAVLYFPTISYNATSFAPNSVGSLGVAPGSHNSSIPFFLLPDLGINFPISQKSAFGISLYSLAGVGSQYKNAGNATVVIPGVGPVQAGGPFGAGTLRSNLEQAVTAITYSRKFLSDSSFGVSLLIGLQALEIDGSRGLAALSAHPNNVSNKRTDLSTGAGARLGFLFGVLPSVDLGISYQPEMIMTKFSQYSGILPDGGKFNIPPYGDVGLAWHVTPAVALVGDVEEIWYSDIPAYGASHNAILAGGTCIPGSGGSTCLGGSSGPGFGWGNQTNYKVGAQWQVSEKTTLRAGVNHSTQVLSNQYATENMITPGALIQNLFTVGATEKISKTDSLNGMIVFIPRQTFTASNLFSGAANQSVTVAAQGFGFGVSWSRMLA